MPNVQRVARCSLLDGRGCVQHGQPTQTLSRRDMHTQTHKRTGPGRELGLLDAATSRIASVRCATSREEGRLRMWLAASRDRSGGMGCRAGPIETDWHGGGFGFGFLFTSPDPSTLQRRDSSGDVELRPWSCWTTLPCSARHHPRFVACRRLLAQHTRHVCDKPPMPRLGWPLADRA